MKTLLLKETVEMKIKTLVAALAVGFGASCAFAQEQFGPARVCLITDKSSL